MKTKIHKLDALKRKVVIHDKLPDLSSKIDSIASKIRPQVSFDGFRKGKAPIALIKEKYSDYLNTQAVEDVVRDLLFAFMKEKNLKLASTPQIEDINSQDNKVEFSASFEVHPELKLKPLKKTKLTLFAGEVSDKDIEDQIESFRKMHATWKEISDESQVVELDQKVQVLLVAFEDKDKKKEKFRQDNLEIQVGSKQIFPEIEESLIGKKKGEVFELPFTFPQDYPSADLAGRHLIFEICVKVILGSHLPELDEEFCKTLRVKSVDQLKEKISKQLHKNLKDALHSINSRLIFDQILEDCEFDIPQSILEKEVDSIQKNTKQSHNQALEAAQKRIKISYIFSNIVEEYGIEITPERIDGFLADEFANSSDQSKSIEDIKSDSNKLEGLRSYLMEKELIKLIFEKSKVTEDKKTYTEILRYRNAQ